MRLAPALDLGHRRRHREEREEEPEAERHLAGLLGPGGSASTSASSPPRGRRHRVDRGRDHPGRPVVVDVGGQPGHRQHEGHDGEAGLQGQCAAVGEAVAVAEPDERPDQDRAQPVPAREVPGVLGVELVAVHLGGHRDGAGRGHGRTLCAGGEPAGSHDGGVAVPPVGRAQLALEDLAGGVAGQRARRCRRSWGTCTPRGARGSTRSARPRWPSCPASATRPPSRVSPQRSSGTPMTATSMTDGCSARTRSTSGE